MTAIEEIKRRLELIKKNFRHADAYIDDDEIHKLIKVVEIYEEALKTAHKNACSCCNSNGEVENHCDNARIEAAKVLEGE